MCRPIAASLEFEQCIGFRQATWRCNDTPAVVREQRNGTTTRRRRLTIKAFSREGQRDVVLLYGGAACGSREVRWMGFVLGPRRPRTPGRGRDSRSRGESRPPHLSILRLMGSPILNNELYIGRLVWNRQRFLKDPDTGKQVARPLAFLSPSGLCSWWAERAMVSRIVQLLR